LPVSAQIVHFFGLLFFFSDIDWIFLGGDSQFKGVRTHFFFLLSLGFQSPRAPLPPFPTAVIDLISGCLPLINHCLHCVVDVGSFHEEITHIFFFSPESPPQVFLFFFMNDLCGSIFF